MRRRIEYVEKRITMFFVLVGKSVSFYQTLAYVRIFNVVPVYMSVIICKRYGLFICSI